MSERFFRWIGECCKALNWPLERGRELVADESWFFCYDDGMKPEEAVKEALFKGVVQRGGGD